MNMFASLAVTLLLAVADACSCTNNPSTVFFKIGNLTAQVTSAGQFVSERNLFNVPDEAVAQSYARLFAQSSPLTLQLNSIVLRAANGKRVLVDAGLFNTGVAEFDRNAGRLIANLRASGVTPESIDIVVITHAHPDHVSGLVDRNGAAAFPNARLFVSEVDVDFWTGEPFNNTSPTQTDEFVAFERDVFRRSIAPYQRNGRLTSVPDGGTVMDGVKMFLTPGDTPGHSRVEIASAGESLVVAGDTWVSQADQLRNPTWMSEFEFNGTQGFESRTMLLEKLAKSRQLVHAYHEAFPGIGHVVRTASGFDWIPSRVEMMGTVRGVCEEK